MATDLNTRLSEVGPLIPGQTERLDELRGCRRRISHAPMDGHRRAHSGAVRDASARGATRRIRSPSSKMKVRAAKAGVAETSDAIALTSAVTKGYDDVTDEAVQKSADLAFKTVELGQTNFPQLAAGDRRRSVPLALLELTITAGGTLRRRWRRLPESRARRAWYQRSLRGASGWSDAGNQEHVDALRGRCRPQVAKALIEQKGLHGALVAIKNSAKATGDPLGDSLSSHRSADACACAHREPDGCVDHQDGGPYEGAAGSVDVAFKENHRLRRCLILRARPGQAVRGHVDAGGTAGRHRLQRADRYRPARGADSTADRSP